MKVTAKQFAGFVFIWLLILSSPIILIAQNPQSGLDAESVMKSDAPVAIAYMISVVILKVTAFVLGYLIVRLGHDTLIKGVTGDFDFGFSGGGVTTKLKAAAPGTFFVLAGAAIILWGLFVSKPYTFELQVKPTAVTLQPATPPVDNPDMVPVLPE